MPKTVTLTPEQRILRARLAGHESWANTSDRAARTAPARKGFEQRFLDQAREKYGDLPETELRQRAEHLKQAHFTRLALASSKARRARKGGAAK